MTHAMLVRATFGLIHAPWHDSYTGGVHIDTDLYLLASDMIFIIE